jgi:hypothetical protein
MQNPKENLVCLSVFIKLTKLPETSNPVALSASSAVRISPLWNSLPDTRSKPFDPALHFRAFRHCEQARRLRRQPRFVVRQRAGRCVIFAFGPDELSGQCSQHRHHVCGPVTSDGRVSRAGGRHLRDVWAKELISWRKEPFGLLAVDEQLPPFPPASFQISLRPNRSNPPIQVVPLLPSRGPVAAGSAAVAASVGVFASLLLGFAALCPAPPTHLRDPSSVAPPMSLLK